MSDVKRYDAKRMMHGDTEYTEIAEDPRGRWVSILDYDSIHYLLVKACVRIANYRAGSLSGVMVTKRIERIKKIYGINLRYTGAGFEEDTTK